MEDEHAVVCLFCGYNTQTRTLGTTKKVASQTGGDKFKWQLPGVICLVLLFVLVLLQNLFILWLGRDARGKDGFINNNLYSEPIFLWATMITAGILWAMGRFVLKRLVLEPTPPEEEIS